MPAAILTTSRSLKNYSVLRNRVRETLLEGRARIEREKVRTYWKTGQYINKHVRLNKGNAAYGKRIVCKLGRDLGIHHTVLHRTARFQAMFPKVARGQLLSWSQYRALLPVKDARERYRLAALAKREDWSAVEIRHQIRARKRLAGNLPEGKDLLLVPKVGTPGTHHVTKDKNGAMSVDLGFRSYVDLSAVGVSGFDAGDRVRWTTVGKLIHAKNATEADLYTYESEVIRVVDGDTIWMKIWLEPPNYRHEKLRLRGIDCPELGTPEGEAAKKFVESICRNTVRLTVTTTKTDKWDRYLSDIFIETKDGELIYLNNELLTHGHAYRSDRVRLEDWL